MTGQTDKVVAKDRQRLFQNVPIGDEYGLTDNLDLLSVTTTMEAGVDIGSLLAAMMANMPPMRFTISNASVEPDAGSAISIALTLAADGVTTTTISSVRNVSPGTRRRRPT